MVFRENPTRPLHFLYTLRARVIIDLLIRLRIALKRPRIGEVFTALARGESVG